MLDTFKDIALINLYWLSLPIAGLGILLLMRRFLSRFTAVKELTIFSLDRPPLIVLLMAFAAMSVFLGVFALFCYIFEAPVRVFVCFYLLTLVVGTGYVLVVLYKNLFNSGNRLLGALLNETLLVKLVVLLLIIILGADYAFSLYAESYALVSADTYVHLSRIVEMLGKGFSSESGFFRNLPETGYHYNLVYALYMPPVYLLDLTPSEVWRYSFGFFRLLQWAAIFTLAWHVISHWIGDKLYAIIGATVATIYGIAFFSAAFFTAVYPSALMNVWLVLLVVALSFYESRPRAAMVPVFAISFLATMTHPTYSLMAAMFISLVFLLRLLVARRKIDRPKSMFFVYGGLVIVLMLGPIKTALFNNKLSATQMHLADFPIITFGDLAMKRPDLSFLQGTTLMSVLIILGTLGMFYLLYRSQRNRRQMAIIAALILFFPIIMYEPIGFSILRLLLPMWVIGRFTAMNVLVFIAVPLGIWALIDIGRRVKLLEKLRLQRKPTINLAVLIFTLALLALSAHFIIPTHRVLIENRVENDRYYEFMQRTYADFSDILKDEQVVVANTGDSYFLAANLPVEVIAVEEGHTTPAADATSRLACQRHILRSFEYADLSSVGVKYVVLAKYDRPYADQKLLVTTKPYLVSVRQNQEFDVYRFQAVKQTPTNAGGVYSACSKFPKVEARR